MKLGTGKMFQQVRTLVAKHEDLILIPKNHKVEPTPTSCLLSSTCTLWCMSACMPTKMHTQAHIIYKFLKLSLKTQNWVQRLTLAISAS